MSLLSFLDLGATGVCVSLIVLALIILWSYVTLSHPDRGPKIVDHDSGEVLGPSHGAQVIVSVSQSRNKKTQKNKGRNKQVDRSPRPGAENTAVSTTASKPLLQKISHEISSKKIQNTKISHEQSTKGKKNQVKSKNIPEDGVSHKEDGINGIKRKDGIKQKEDGDTNEGEWQTQLSRPQLRALKQKQRQNEVSEKDSAVIVEKLGGTVSEEIPKGYQPVTQVNNSGDNSSPDPGFSALIPAGDVEYALREAACGSLSAEESKSTTDTSTKKSRRKKKSRKKAVPASTDTSTPSPALEDGENQEEWVLI